MKIKRSLSENTSCVLRSESTMSVHSFARRITQAEIHEEHTDPEYAVHLPTDRSESRSADPLSFPIRK